MGWRVSDAGVLVEPFKRWNYCRSWRILTDIALLQGQLGPDSRKRRLKRDETASSIRAARSANYA